MNGAKENEAHSELAQALSLMSRGEFERGLRVLDQRYGRQIERRFLRYGMPEADAQEQTWILLTKLYEHFSAGHVFTESEFWSWSTRVLRNQFIDWYRHQKRYRDDVSIDEANDAALNDDAPLPGWLGELKAQEIDPALIDCLQQAFAEFSVRYPERAEHLVMLVESWSNEEIAKALGVKEGAARDRIYQTRLKLRPYADPCLER